MAYYSQSEIIEHFSVVVRSYCLKLDPVVTHFFKTNYADFSGKLKELAKIYNFSDGHA